MRKFRTPNYTKNFTKALKYEMTVYTLFFAEKLGMNTDKLMTKAEKLESEVGYEL